MVRKKIDNRIRTLIENGVKLGHRTMFVVVGDKGRDQVRYHFYFMSMLTVLKCNEYELLFLIINVYSSSCSFGITACKVANVLKCYPFN